MAKRNVSVEMEDVLISDIEAEMELSGFSTRSEFIKVAIRYYIQVQHDRRASADLVAIKSEEGALQP